MLVLVRKACCYTRTVGGGQQDILVFIRPIELGQVSLRKENCQRTPARSAPPICRMITVAVVIVQRQTSKSMAAQD